MLATTEAAILARRQRFARYLAMRLLLVFALFNVSADLVYLLASWALLAFILFCNIKLFQQIWRQKKQGQQVQRRNPAEANQ
jgi:hypothetical protein